MTRSAPLVLLDLDGVLNPFAAPVCPDGCLEHEFFDGEGPERYCPAHAGWTRADVDRVLAWVR
jgi:hypothetical protein